MATMATASANPDTIRTDEYDFQLYNDDEQTMMQAEGSSHLC